VRRQLVQLMVFFPFRNKDMESASTITNTCDVHAPGTRRRVLYLVKRRLYSYTNLLAVAAPPAWKDDVQASQHHDIRKRNGVIGKRPVVLMGQAVHASDIGSQQHGFRSTPAQQTNRQRSHDDNAIHTAATTRSKQPYKVGREIIAYAS